MITEEQKERVKHIRENMGTRRKWGMHDYEDFYDNDVKFLLSLADKLIDKEPKELVREVMKIDPAEMPSLTPEQRVCVGCQECCCYLTFIVGEDIINAYCKVYEARGCTMKRIEGSIRFSLRVPSVCPHLTEYGCDIYEERPQHCRDYDGTLDPFMQDLCKLINFKRG